jgi:hypothetical protein
VLGSLVKVDVGLLLERLAEVTAGGAEKSGGETVTASALTPAVDGGANALAFPRNFGGPPVRSEADWRDGTVCVSDG